MNSDESKPKETKKFIVIGGGTKSITPDMIEKIKETYDLSEVVILTEEQARALPPTEHLRVEELVMPMRPHLIPFSDDIIKTEIRKETKFKKQQEKYRARQFRKK